MHLSNRADRCIVAANKVIEVLSPMKKPYYGWLVCLGCAIILFCTSGLAINAFTIYQPYILRQNGFTNTQSSTILTVRSFVCFLSMFLTGQYYKRFSLRAGLSLSGGITAAGFALFGLARSFPAYCAAAAVVGLGYGLGTMIPIAMLMERWFFQKRTLAIGLCSCVTGLSTLGIPTILIRLIERLGLAGAFFVEAACITALTLIAFLLLRSDPAEMGLSPYGADTPAELKQHGIQTHGIRRKDWLLLMPMLLLLGAMTSTGYSHLSVLLTSNGFSVDIAALAISISGVTLVAAKCLFGAVSGRLSTFRCNWLFGAAGIAGLILLCVMGNDDIMMLGGVVLYSAGLAMTTVGLTAWAGDWSSTDQYDATIRRFQIGYAAGGLAFSSVPGILADRFGGSYIPAYLFFAACAIIVLLLAQFMYLNRRRSQEKRRVFSLTGRFFHPRVFVSNHTST